MSIPIDLPFLETLALSHIFKPEEIVEQGLRERIEDAQKTCSAAVLTAVSALQELGIEEGPITALVEERVKAAATSLRQTLGSSN